MLQSQNIRIFRKDNSTFCGSIWRRGGFFEADLISIPDSDRLMARLSHIKPELIIGREENNILLDSIEYISPDDEGYIGAVAKTLSKEFGDFYFIVSNLNPDWKKIEDDIANALLSGLIEKKEREIILNALRNADKNQILLLYAHLKNVDESFSSYMKKIQDKK